MASKGNPYGLKEDAPAGVFDPYVSTTNTDGSVVKGGVDLHPSVVEALGVDGDHVPLPVDIGSSARVVMTFDVVTLDLNGPVAVHRALLSFGGETLPVSNVIPQTKNKGAIGLVMHPGLNFNWYFLNKALANFGQPDPITDDTAIGDVVVFGEKNSTSTLDIVTDVHWNSPVPLGRRYANAANSVSVSVMSGHDSRPVVPMTVGDGIPVFVQSLVLS